MKKIGLLLAALLLVTGCSSKTTTSTPTPTPEATPESTVETTSSMMAGVGSVVTFGNKDAAADAEGTIQINTTIASVVLDESGKIVYVDFDVLQEPVNFDATGVVNAETAVETPSKKEKGDAYGMVKASSIGKEWYEQAASLEAYMMGKTMEEVKALPVGEDFKVMDEDLLTSVTIKVNDYLAALEVAVENAVEVNVATTFGTGKSASISPKDATSDAAGAVQVTATYVLVGFDAEGKVAFTVLDAAQNKATFTNAGVCEEATAIPSKKIRKEDYGMLKASAIGKEWYQQAEGFEAWTVGKTVAEITGSSMDEEGHSTDEDLMSSCTVGVDGFFALVEEASENAK